MLQASIPTVFVSVAVTPRETRILPRGNWMDDSGKIVQPAVPMFLGKLDTGGRRATRLDFANWLVSTAESADRQGFCQPVVAAILRDGHFQGAERFRLAG